MKNIIHKSLLIIATLMLIFTLGCETAQDKDPLEGQISEIEETPEYIVQYTKGYNLARSKNFKAAIKNYKNAYNILSNMDESKMNEKAMMTYRNTVLGLGRAYGNIDDMKNSSKYFEMYIDKYPNQYNGYLYYGAILEKKGYSDKAQKQFEKAMEVNPDSAQAEFALANIMREKGMLEEAIKFYKKGLEKDPEFQNGNGWFQLAKTYEQMGDLDGQISAYENLIEYRPENSEACCSLADSYLSKGLSIGRESGAKELTAEQKANRIKYYKEAVKYAEKAYEISPNSTRAANFLANSYLKLSDMYTKTDPAKVQENASKVLPVAKKIVENNPDSTAGYTLLAEANLKLKNYRKAIDNAKKSLEVEDTAYARSILADTYFEIENWEQAYTHYIKIVDNPNYPYVKGRLKIVNKRLRGEYN